MPTLNKKTKWKVRVNLAGLTIKMLLLFIMSVQNIKYRHIRRCQHWAGNKGRRESKMHIYLDWPLINHFVSMLKRCCFFHYVSRKHLFKNFWPNICCLVWYYSASYYSILYHPDTPKMKSKQQQCWHRAERNRNDFKISPFGVWKLMIKRHFNFKNKLINAK